MIPLVEAKVNPFLGKNDSSSVFLVPRARLLLASRPCWPPWTVKVSRAGEAARVLGTVLRRSGPPGPRGDTRTVQGYFRPCPGYLSPSPCRDVKNSCYSFLTVRLLAR